MQMPSTIATYNRDKRLNVRAEPTKGARVLRQMRKGDSEECFGIEDGWSKLHDGYAMAKFLEFERVPGEPAETAEEPARESAEEPHAGAPDAGDGRETLRKMTNPELYDLAAQSGVKVKKGARKEEIIDALLGDD